MSDSTRPRTPPETRAEAPGDAAALEASQRRSAVILLVIGILAIGLSALTLASAGYGSRPTESFAQRRSYNMVKTDVHQAFPRALLIGLAGLGLAIAGHRKLSRVGENAGAGPGVSPSPPDSASSDPTGAGSDDQEPRS